MTSWKTYKLGDICSRLRSGRGIPASEVSTCGKFAVVGGNGVRGYTDTSNFNGQCVVVGRQGAYCGNVRYFDGEFYMTEHAVVIVGNELADTHFLAYLLSTMHLGQLSAQSAQPGLSVQTLSKLEITLPSLEEQRRIAGILGAIDDKIENNRHINANLESQAQALFEEFFFSNNNWEHRTLGDLTEEVKERVNGRDAKVLSPISSGELVLSEDYFTKQVYSQDISKYIVVEPNSFAYNPARINIGSIGINAFDFTGCVSPVYVVFKTKNEYENFFRLFAKSDIFKEEVKSRAIGGVRQTLSYQDFAMIKVKYPPLEIVREFNSRYTILLNLLNHNTQENDRLASLRDTLLPKLMNGELKIGDSFVTL